MLRLRYARPLTSPESQSSGNPTCSRVDLADYNMSAVWKCYIVSEEEEAGLSHRRETHAFQPIHTLHTLYFSRREMTRITPTKLHRYSFRTVEQVGIKWVPCT